jgi:hypothetical protein
MNGGIPSRGLLNAGNIPFDLQEKIGQEIEPYSIIPLLDGQVSGSETLVTIDGTRGILTAGHVVRNWHDSKPKDQHPKRLGIVPGRRASTLVEERLEHFDSFVIEQRDSEIFGPRPGFRSYSFSERLSERPLTKKSFLDLSGPGVTNRMVFITRTAPLASCGIVAEKTERIGRNIVLNQYVFFGTEPRVFERDGAK